MKGVRLMSIRLTWDEIQKKYPMQWVGLTDVEWDEDNVDVESAVVSYHNLPKSEATSLMIKSKGNIVARFTEPNKVLFMGTMFNGNCI